MRSGRQLSGEGWPNGPPKWGQSVKGRYHGPCNGLTHTLCRIRPIPVSGGNPAVPDAGTAGGIHARQELARAWRPGRRTPPRHQPSAARREDRDGLPRLWLADLRDRLGRQCRPDAGGETLRAREGLPPGHLRDVVDQGVDPGIHPAFVVAREDGHHREPEEAVLQPAQGEEQDLRARGRRHAPRSGQADREAPRRSRAGRDRDEPPARRRCLAQRADPRGRRCGRMAGLAGRRHA